MKRILIITLEYPPQVGGIATYVHDLAGALSSDKIVVLAPKYLHTEGWDKQQNHKIIRKNLLFPKFIWPRWLKLCCQVWHLVKKEKIELIMIHHVLPVGYVGIIQKVIRKIPFLLFSHGTDLVAGTETKWKKAMVRKVSAHAEQIIFNSENLKRRYLRVLPEFENKSTVVYPCPNKNYAIAPDKEILEKMRNKYGLEGKKVLLSISRLVDGKGFPHLVRILPEVLRRVPNLVWLIVGDGPKKDLIMNGIQRDNLQNIVRYVGEVPFGDLNKYYHLADVFILLTHPDEGKEEGLGLVFLEAAAAGIPAIAGRSGGVEEAVIHGQTGLVVDVYRGDKEIVEAIVELLNNKELAARLGTQAQERILTSFIWKNQMKLLEKWIL